MEGNKRKESLIAADSSYPFVWSKSEWDKWNSHSSQPYLEVFGEAYPIICTNLMETLPTHSVDNDLPMPSTLPIYEYYWTIGISDHLHRKFVKHITNIFHKGANKLRKLDIGAEVTLYFPLSGGWRVEEVVATIKYVRPLPHHESLTKKVAEYWETVSPVIAKLSEVAGRLPIPAVSTGSTLLNTLAKVPITSLPPVDGISWEVKKVTGHMESEIMEGIQWTLPKKLFYILGNRVTGSIAVYFHPAHNQHNEGRSDNYSLPLKCIVAEAVVYDGDQFTTFGKEAVKLELKPQSITDWQKRTATHPDDTVKPDHD